MDDSNLRVEGIVQRLRADCPWNGRQKPEDILDALEAEVNELRQSLYSGAAWGICEELGDILFNLVAIAECFREQGLFTLADVDKEICDKMIRRHPYVFEGTPDPGPERARLLWEGYKTEEIAKRQSNRMGISIVCEIYEVKNTKLSSTDWLNETLLQVSAVVGIRPALPKLIASDSTRDQRSLVSLAVPPAHLLLQAFPTRRLALLQGFTDNEIKPTELRDCIVERFETEEVEMILLERGHHRL